MAIYLDSNATTKVHPRVVEAMMPFLTGHWQNPSSNYAAGRDVRNAIEIAREQVAALIGAHPDEIVFTGSGTEANSTVIKSLAREIGRRHSRVVVSAIEHSAVIRPVEAMAAVGFEVKTARVGEDGRLDLDAFASVVVDTCPGFASVMGKQRDGRDPADRGSLRDRKKGRMVFPYRCDTGGWQDSCAG